MNKRPIIAFALAFACFYSVAEESSRSLSLSFTASSRAEAQVKLSGTLTVPTLAGDGPLTKDNSVALTASCAVTPVSVTGAVEAVFTPVAFFQLVAGGMVATGWNIPIADGLSFNEPGRDGGGALDGTAEFVGDSFPGIVWSCKGGAVAQFDFAAIRPGEWNHVVFRSSHTLWYRAFTAADSDDSWQFENDVGEERNGWNYYANYFLGYQMPVKLSMVGILFEQELNLYDTPGRTAWGDDISRFTIGLMGQYDLSKEIRLNALVQARTKRNFVGTTGDYEFYQLREIDSDDPRRLEFYRVAVIVKWTLM